MKFLILSEPFPHNRQQGVDRTEVIVNQEGIIERAAWLLGRMSERLC